jgi:hypothetical protein
VVASQFQNPIQAAKDAYNKAKADAAAQKQQQQPQQQPQQQTPPQANSTGGAEPWKPPVENSDGATVALDPAKMPDIVGVHLGMTPQEAMQIMRKQYPANFRVLVMPANSPLDGQPIKAANDNFQISDPATAGAPLGYISFTAPPEKQVVWHVARYTLGMHINRETLLVALRQKYGQESAALMSTGMGSGKTTDSSRISEMFWLFDEHGGRVPYPPDTAFQNRTIWDCTMGSGTVAVLVRPDAGGPTDDAALTKTFSNSGWCGSFVGVHVQISDPGPIVDTVFTEMMDIPLAIRTAHASAVWWRAVAEKARKDDLEKSKQAKPVF